MSTHLGTAAPTPLLGPAYRWPTIGMVGLILAAAFESLAVTTIMPEVTADLDGRGWYAVSFSAVLAASVVGMVVGGTLADRTGPGTPLVAAVGVFAAGLLVAGLAPSIEAFVLARFLQGLGSGGLVVSLYVLVGTTYAPVDHPRIFGAFAAAWVLPSLVGPTLAGLIAAGLGWRWVFLLVVGVTGAMLAAVLPAVRRHGGAPPPAHLGQPPGGTPAPTPGPSARARLGLAVAVAAAVVALDLATQLEPGEVGPPTLTLVVLALGAAALAVRPLLPSGTLRAARGLPAVVAQRGLVAGAFFSAEIYVPFVLQAAYDLPAWLSGLTLTVAAVSWAGASQVQARLGARLAHTTALRVGAALVLGGLAALLLVVVTGLPPLLVGATWMVAGAGMGLQFPRMGSFVLAASTAGERGRNTSALSISDAAGAAVAVALSGLVLTAVAHGSDHPARGAFALTLLVPVVLGLLTNAAARRTVRATCVTPESPRTVTP